MRRLLVIAALLMLALPAARAEEGDPFAAGAAAYEAGDYETARALWQPLAEAGDPKAQYALAGLLREGRGAVETDLAGALHWYKEIARHAEDVDIYRRAVHDLGYMVDQGTGVGRNRYIAACLYQNAAEHDYLKAQWNFCILTVKEGAEFPESQERRTIRFCKLAASGGIPNALGREGEIDLWNPLTVDEQGYMKLIVAARRGSEEAARRLNEIRTRPTRKVREQLARAEKMARVWTPRPEAMPSRVSRVPEICLPKAKLGDGH